MYSIFVGVTEKLKRIEEEEEEKKLKKEIDL
jgi:hypothetical protein